MPILLLVYRMGLTKIVTVRPSTRSGRTVLNGNGLVLALALAVNGDDGVDLHGGVERQAWHAHGAAGMAARFTENPHHHLGRAIGDLGLVGEIGSAGHEGAELHDSLD